MKKKSIAAGLLCLFLGINSYGQTVNATVGGTVADSSGAVIPGVSVKLTNNGTGIMTSIVTNETGAYQFPGVQPGNYKLSAELPGFQTQTFTDVQMGGGQQVTLNFVLKVAQLAGQTVEVTLAADTVLATSSNSVGTVLPEFKIRDLPVLTGNVLNLVQNTPGVQRNAGGTFGFMAGGRLGDVNATRDGINVNDGRYENGAWSSVFTSPDMVQEIKVVIAPVDAETSRGSGQVSMVTRSGGNAFNGSVAWSNHNSALDANSWFNNFNGVSRSYDNRNLYSARLGGPIVQNKTFFFVLFTGQRDVKRTQATGLTFTDMAKAGIFRFYPGIDNQNSAGNSPVVDASGNPSRGVPNAVGLFGSCAFNGQPVPNCTTFNDPLRTAVSSSPFLQEELKRMPSPNNFAGGDGLNTANIRFVRRQSGLDLTNGNGDEVNRDQYNARIDHNFNSKHRLSVIGTNEKTWATATQAGLRAWPDAYDGLAVKRPVVYTIQLNSTLTRNIFNQLRLGKSGTNNWQWGPADRGDETGAEARKLLAFSNDGSGIPIGTVTFATGILPFATKGQFGRWREGINPRYSIGDDVSWTMGRHAFKAGFEYRRTESNGFNDPNITPTATLGAGSQPTVLDGTVVTGLTATNASLARNILYDLTGSISTINEAFAVVSAKDPRIVSTPTVPNNRHWWYQSEESIYFKDDWKFRPGLTFNLGVHWEYYGQPYEHDGLAAQVVGGPDSFLKIQCAGTPGVVGSATGCTNLATVQFVGKNSTNPKLGTYVNGNDFNNFAPSIGFAWNLPWFGEGKTVLRAGYGVNYSGALRNFITVDGVLGTVPGINLISGGSGRNYAPSTYTSLSTFTLPIPLATGTPTTSPFAVPTTERSLGITTYQQLSPYTQSWNLEIQREVFRNTVVEVRYVGTKGTKLWSNVNLNALNWLRPQGASDLFAAFNAARTGGESPLLNTLLNGVALSGGCGVVNGTTCTGAMAFRGNTTTRAQLANGNFGAFLNSLNTTLQYTGGPSDAGSILRRAGFPDDYLVPAPQYAAVNVAGNNQNSTYHALNIQVTRRLAKGFSNTTTYIWSKAIGANAFVDPNNRASEKSLQDVDRTHQITSNGTYELPFGTNHFLLGNAPGWVQSIVGKWQLGGILNFNTGAPISLTSGITTISNIGARPVVLGDLPKGKIRKVSNGVTFFDPTYTVVPDPTFATISPTCAASTTACNGLFSAYTNKAIQDPSGKIILTNPLPGQTGNLGENSLRGPKSFYFDMNIVKRFRIDEKREFEFRVDAINVLNHANFAAPQTSINSTNFGRITALTTELVGNGMRSFIVNTRVNF